MTVPFPKPRVISALIVVGLCALARTVGTARAEPPPCAPPARVLVLMCLNHEELNAVQKGDRSFSPIVAEYLARQELVGNEQTDGKKDAKQVDLVVAKRLISFGLIHRVEEGEKLEMFLEGMSGQWYRTREHKQYEVFRATDAVDPTGLFIIRVEH